MWKPQTNDEKQEEGTGSVAVAVDKDKGSQYALKWAIDNILNKGQRVTLIHVKQRPSGAPTGPNSNKDQSSSPFKQHDAQSKEIFLSFRCFCSRKDIKCEDVVLEHTDIAKAIIEFVSHRTIETLVLGSSSKSSLLRRFKVTDVPTSVSKAAPDFCSVYIISKGKVSSVRTASKKVQNVIPLKTHIQNQESFKPTNPPASEPARFAQNNLSTNSTKGISPFEQPRNIAFEQQRNLPYEQQRNLPFEQQRNSQYEQQRNSPYEQQRNSPYEQQRNSLFEHRSFHDDLEPIRSPFTRGGRSSTDKQSYGGGDMLNPVDISFVSSGRPSTDRMFPSLFDHYDMSRTPRLSNSSDLDNRSFESLRSAPKSMDFQSMSEFSMTSGESGRMSNSSQNMEDVEAEMRRLKIELKQTMDMYSTACKEALSAKQQAKELHRWKMEEEQRLQEARLAEEAALAIAHMEKAKCKAALEAAEASQRLAELEAQKRMSAEMKALKETEEKKKALSTLAHSDVRYRKYTIEEIEVATEYFNESRKIGEGGYGPVFKCFLDHTPVAVKVLRPDAAQGRSQFQQEVEVLSCIRHPNMVLLLGACPEYGCLVYEYMANGSLDDCLFRRENSPVLSWQLRFRIAAEIATGLLFLHQTKPEPLVHRDLKPGNILLDRNYVSKISDVGLARLVPPSVANHVTQYRMTSTAGTFCYIDPEYQQTGMLGIKSDIYSLGIMLLQIITAKSPMGLTHHVERAIEKGQFAEMLDPDVHDWPVEEALGFAKLALNCAELRKKDRPDLGKVVLPELNRLRSLAEETMPQTMLGGCSSAGSSPYNSRISSDQEVISDPMLKQSAYDSSRSRVSDPMLRQSGYDNTPRSRLSEPQLRQSGYDTSRSRLVAAPTGWR